MRWNCGRLFVNHGVGHVISVIETIRLGQRCVLYCFRTSLLHVWGPAFDWLLNVAYMSIDRAYLGAYF
jgi:hypothetical protein